MAPVSYGEDVRLSHVAFLRARSSRPEHVTLLVALAACTLAWAGLEDAWHSALAGGGAVLVCVAFVGLFLAQEWSAAARRWLGYATVAGPRDATHVFAIPLRAVAGMGGAAPAAAGEARIVPLERVPPPPSFHSDSSSSSSSSGGGGGGGPSLRAIADRILAPALFRFSFHSTAHEVWEEAGGHLRIEALPAVAAEPLAAYAAWRGWPTYTQASAAGARFGANKVEVPVPAFFELAREHAVAPFFVFQLFCVALWCLDEYVWYSLFTLTMLASMEALLVTQRINTARMLRGMRPAPATVYAWRGGAWSIVRGEDLVPLDIISLAREPPKGAATTSGIGSAPAGGAVTAPAAAPSHAACPADVLLLSGSVVVNEAMLTGESTPQMKEALSDLEGLVAEAGAEKTSTEERLNAFATTGDRSHARSVVFAGTLVIAAEASGGSGRGGNEGGSSIGGARRALPPHLSPPDGGCAGLVVRTGTYTAQGELLRAIMHASGSRASVDTDAFIFLAIMLVFAVLASGYVLSQGLADPSRDRWKLVLHCIMIITTVIPPELPVELSLATNQSLTALMRRGIFCTEPARIPKAGNVDCVAFDKTGTLTADEFTVHAVVLLPPPASGGGGGAPPLPLRVKPTECGAASRIVLLGCHALVQVQVPIPPPPRAPLSKPAPPPPTTYRLELAGDPIEKASLRALGWTVNARGAASPVAPPPPAPPAAGAAGTAIVMPPPAGPVITVVRRWAFSSALRRMTCCVHATSSPLPPTASAANDLASLPFPSGKEGAAFVVCKGAPEAIEELLLTVPLGYASAHSKLAAGGNRVLALAYKPLGKASCSVSGAEAAAGAINRVGAEKELIFAGFLVAASPLKTDSERTVRELQAACVRVLMITGDAPLTACAVARQLRMGPGGAKEGGPGSRAAYVLDVDMSSGGGVDAPMLSCQLVMDASESIVGAEEAALSDGPPPSPSDELVSANVEAFRGTIEALLKGPVNFAARLDALRARVGGARPVLCVTGRALDAVGRGGGPLALATLCDATTVFARVSPAQKEFVIGVLEGEGLVPLTPAAAAAAAARGEMLPPRRYFTAMVGDGSNDTGALKRAQVGLAVISNPDVERRYDTMRVQARTRVLEQQRKQRAEAEKLGEWALKAVDGAIARASLMGEEAEENEEELSALLKPESERVQALGLLTGREGEGAEAAEEAGGGVGLLASMTKTVQAQAAASGRPDAAAQSEALLKKLKEFEAEMGGGGGTDGGMGGPAVAQLGDASMAAPLTSKLPTPLAIVEVLRQGRCTLVTTHTMFKILAVNSLTAAYQLSVLYLNDVKTGDYQATFSGIGSSILFFSISWAKPRRRLGAERPPARVLNAALILTVAVQALMHLTALMLVARLAGYDPDPPAGMSGNATSTEGVTSAAPTVLDSFSFDDATTLAAEATRSLLHGKLGLDGGAAAAAAATDGSSAGILDAAAPVSSFRPNHINSAVWLLTTASQATTFLLSYHGMPFMVPLQEATTLLYGALAVYGIATLGASGLSSTLNSYFQLVPLPTLAARATLAAIIIADAGVCFVCDRLIKRVFKRE